ncbi:MAG: c-type cytochrome [Bauldia sp.]|nr:c-type cytochrome [Bauldia sp.]
MRRKTLVTAIAFCLVAVATAWSEEAPPAGDIAAGKAVAASCAACHGSNGVSPQAGVPHIAGQHASYIQSTLVAYATGTRKNESMQQAVAKLGEQEIADVAAYYASLTGFNARPKEPGAVAVADADQDPFAAVKKLTAMCAGCHGEDGNAKVAATPSLSGQHDTYLITAMQAYQDGTRAEPMMQALAKPLTRSQIEDIAYFYAAMVPRRFGAPAEGDAIAGLAVTTPCAGCHGADGNSTNPKNPRLAGLSADYLIAAIDAYKDRSRKHDVMRDQVLPLRDQDVKDLAAYYASQEPQALPIRKPLTLAEWTARCSRCHGANGNSTDTRFPVLAGQDDAYLAKAMALYHGGDRSNTLMYAMSFLMAESDIKSLAAYYARQRKE